ncbi:MAG: 1-acyl-sn-glycerol-3-phosphate acyltransferase [Phycisphaera sp.]|nr:1-acyl-sn-glycerol-3-phosphate acyltransferase [Phycisphaera sp.]
MFKSLRQRQPGRSLFRILWWYALWSLCLVWFKLCYRYRASGQENIPREGPVLFLSNHQSFLDPIAVGLGAHRRQFYAMARSTLWNNRLLAIVIDSLNALPVDREAAEIGAIRTCIDVMKKGHALLVFPEGTRTGDGKVLELQPGVMLLVRRAKPTVIPVAIDGTFGVWSRHMKKPGLHGRVHVRFGKPIPAEKLLTSPTEEALSNLRNMIEQMRVSGG